MTYASGKEVRSREPHPYLHGNFAPFQQVQPLTPCSFTGTIPDELAGGEYVRNGGNPVSNGDLGRDAHWFDGDGMLSGVAFRRTEDGHIQPEFVNQYILTDVYLATVTTPSLRLPILPSIATLVNPASSLSRIVLRILRTIFLVLISHLPGSRQAIKKISVANTGFLYHDGRALATCESGPPMRISLPGLETIGWFNGLTVEGELTAEDVDTAGFGGDGLLSFMKDWTTAHPRVDPTTKELILYHSAFLAPFVHYSIIPSTQHSTSYTQPSRLINAPIPGITASKMMHDFGVSLKHTVIMDLPLSLDPRNLLRNEPVVSYDPTTRSRFGVFPRWAPDQVRWFETNPCCIFHTANTWDEINTINSSQQVTAVSMLACRLTSASLVFSAGAIAAPIPKENYKNTEFSKEEEQCRLYYYRFPLSPNRENTISHQFALSAIPFEFPSLREDCAMSNARYVYGCSTSDSSFGAALGRAVKIDSLVKIDTQTLISRGLTLSQGPNPSITPIIGCVDTRSVSEVLESTDPNDPIKVFKMPPGWYAQESRFVPRRDGVSEDDGWILSYVFDEGSFLDDRGEVREGARSELWVVDAKGMREVVCRVVLPQRVPYGLHGSWFSEEDVLGQRKVERIREVPTVGGKTMDEENDILNDIWMALRGWVLGKLG